MQMFPVPPRREHMEPKTVSNPNARLCASEHIRSPDNLNRTEFILPLQQDASQANI